MKLCKTDRNSAFKLIKAQCQLIYQYLDIDKISISNLTSLLDVQAHIIDQIADVADTRASNKARMAKKLSKKLKRKL